MHLSDKYLATKATISAHLAPSGDEAAYFQATYESEGQNVLSAMRAGWK